MESLTNFKVKKDGVAYESVLSPETIGTNKQIKQLVEKDGKLVYVTEDGEKQVGGASLTLTKMTQSINNNVCELEINDTDTQGEDVFLVGQSINNGDCGLYNIKE